MRDVPRITVSLDKLDLLYGRVSVVCNPRIDLSMDHEAQVAGIAERYIGERADYEYMQRMEAELQAWLERRVYLDEIYFDPFDRVWRSR